MTGRLNTRKREGASAEDTRLTQTRFERVITGALVRAATISFTGPGTIADSANGLGVFRIGQSIRVQGSTLNDNVYVVRTVAAGSITVESVNGQGVKTQIAGPTITITPEE